MSERKIGGLPESEVRLIENLTDAVSRLMNERKAEADERFAALEARLAALEGKAAKGKAR